MYAALCAIPHIGFICNHVYVQVEMGGALGGALEAGVDEQQWRLEVERVLPSLRVHLRQDNRVRERGGKVRQYLKART